MSMQMKMILPALSSCGITITWPSKHRRGTLSRACSGCRRRSRIDSTECAENKGTCFRAATRVCWWRKAKLGQVCHYLHLNPVRAGVVPAAQLAQYRHSSYWYLQRKRPACLSFVTALAEAGGLSDTRAGWRSYQDYLAWQAESGPAGRNRAYASLSRGWALGSKEFKTAL